MEADAGAEYVPDETPAFVIGAIEEAEEEEHAAEHEEHEEHEKGRGEAPATAAIMAQTQLDPASNMRPLAMLSGEMSDWMECLDTDTDAYYCNLVTGERSWTPPFELLPPPPSERHSPRTESWESSRVRSTGATEANESNAEGLAGEDEAARLIVKRVMDGTLRRLDPHTQMQLEEARRRHKELEELRDQEVLMGGEHWIEMYDPTHDGFYYYGIGSGEMRWDRPDLYVMKVESDDVLRMVVRMQCAFRIKLARRKVFQMKLQRGLVEGEVNPWVEVYDPFHKVLYYYSATTGETRWDPPEHFISASEDREMAAAIAIQSMSRSHMARREVKKRKATIRKKQRDQAMEEARKLREIRRREYFAKSDAERESICRREMLEEEMEQIKDGDLFWGQDKHDQEVIRQRMEEKMLADSEAFWQRVNLTLRLRCEMEKQRTQEEEAQRKEMEMIAEANECDRMRDAEGEQCQMGDCFWGIQAEERRELKARQDMDVELEGSRVSDAKAHEEDLRKQWAEERMRRMEQAEIDKVVNEKKYQRQYFKWFYGKAQTADDVLEYLWPTKQRYTPPSSPENNQDGSSPEKTDRVRSKKLPAAQKDPPYLLDDIVLQARMEDEYRYYGKSIFTIHDPKDARVDGRRGLYVMTHVDTESTYVKAEKKADRQSRSTSPTRPMPASFKPIPNDTGVDEEERIQYGMFPALHFRHTQLPDPHLPARYNGVPYRPSEVSPTRDILMGQHTKLTQLPSLALTRTKAPSPKKKPTKGPQQSTTSSPHGKSKSIPKKKHSSFFLAMHDANNNVMDPLNSSMGFVSPFYRELRNKSFLQKHETEEKQQREAKEHLQCEREQYKYKTQFDKEELPVVRGVFEMMDYDGSSTINKRETVWALQRDGEVQVMANKSALLRLLLKQPMHLDELFTHLRVSDAQREEISWDIFRVFCEEMYISLKQQGILDALSPQKQPAEKKSRKEQPKPTSSHTHRSSGTRPSRGFTFVEAAEEQLIRRVFALCDQDGNGVLEIEELTRALYSSPDPELQALVQASKALQPLLRQDTFIDAFRKFEPMNPSGICEEEFVVFCLEIAELAMLNGMM